MKTLPSVFVALLVAAPVYWIVDKWEYSRRDRTVTHTVTIGGKVVSRIQSTNDWVTARTVSGWSKTGQVVYTEWITNKVER